MVVAHLLYNSKLYEWAPHHHYQSSTVLLGYQGAAGFLGILKRQGWHGRSPKIIIKCKGADLHRAKSVFYPKDSHMRSQVASFLQNKQKGAA